MNEQTEQNGILPQEVIKTLNSDVEKLKKMEWESVKVTEAEKLEFMKCFLADKCYSSISKICNDSFIIKFKTLTVEEQSAISRQISFDQEKNIAENTDAYAMRVMSYRLGLSIVELNGKPFQQDITIESHPFDKEIGASYISERAVCFSKWSLPKFAGVQEAFRTFENKVMRLTNELNNKDFWKANP